MNPVTKWLKENWTTLTILTILVYIAYANSFFNAFVSDDRVGILQNPNVGNLSSIFNRPYAFVQPLLYYLLFKIGGLNPIVYRLVNIIFHTGTVWLVFILVSFLTTTTIAFITAAIFAVHPILTESIAWISGGIYIRYSFFFLASLIIYLKSRSNKKLYAISFILFIVSLFSSDKAITIPLLFLLYEFSLGNLRKNWKWLILFFAASIIWVLLYLFQIGGKITQEVTQSYIQPTWFNPFLQIPIAISSYLQLLVWPNNLTLYHSEMSFSFVEYVVRLITFLGFIGLIGWSWVKNKQIFFWLMFFIISLLPTLTPFGISWVVAERYVYLGSIGIIAVSAYLFSRMIKNKKSEAIGYLILIIIVLGLMARTIVRNMDLKNEDALWIATGKTSPSDPKTHNNLGDVYGRWGDLKRSAEEFKIAIKLNPRYADAYHNLGNTYRQMGSPSAALQEYLLALKYNPYLWQSHQNIAGIYFQEGKFSDALSEVQKAIQIVPDNPQLYVSLGAIYLELKQKENAKQAFLQALALDPNNQQARLGLSQIQ